MAEPGAGEAKKNEIEILLEAIYRQYGYDFRNYARAHIKRRIFRFLARKGLESVSTLQYRVLNDPDWFDSLLLDFSINVTGMFRDPHYYKCLREEVLPILRTFPFIRIWNAGCSSGEEVYSMAILLYEEGLLDRCLIYATDFNDSILEKAKTGIYPIGLVQDYTRNYQQSGGNRSFSEYYTADDTSVIMKSSLKERIVYANHNLVSDGVFGEMHVIVCRNVLIYFDRILQERVLNLFHESFCYGGFLCLGARESIRFSDLKKAYRQVCGKERIYKKITAPGKKVF